MIAADKSKFYSSYFLQILPILKESEAMREKLKIREVRFQPEFFRNQIKSKGVSFVEDSFFCAKVSDSQVLQFLG